MAAVTGVMEGFLFEVVTAAVHAEGREPAALRPMGPLGPLEALRTLWTPRAGGCRWARGPCGRQRGRPAGPRRLVTLRASRPWGRGAGGSAMVLGSRRPISPFAPLRARWASGAPASRTDPYRFRTPWPQSAPLVPRAPPPPQGRSCLAGPALQSGRSDGGPAGPEAPPDRCLPWGPCKAGPYRETRIAFRP